MHNPATASIFPLPTPGCGLFKGFWRKALLGWGLLLATAVASPASDRETVKAIRRTMPAVLSITTYRDAGSGERPRAPHFAGEPGDPQARNMARREVLSDSEIENVASGFFIDKHGHLITNAHVLEAPRRLRVMVTTQDGQELEARPVAVDEEADLALLKVDAPGTKFRHFNLRRLSENRLGQTVIALGNPVGYGNSISKGVLSASNRNVNLDGMVYRDLLQTDAAINPGSSGGPIVDLDGRLVGVSSVKLAFDEAGMPLQGIGFAIPASKVVEVLGRMANRQEAAAAVPAREPSQRGFLTAWLPRLGGEGAESVTVPQVLETLGLEVALPTGKNRRLALEPPRIADVYLDSQAEAAGLQPGERVFRIDQVKLDEGGDFTLAKLALTPGATVELEVGTIIPRRGGNWKQVRVVEMAVE